MSELIFGFDLGKGSIGLAVRKGNEILFAKSLLIDESVASIEDQAKRRRQYRTRLSHKKREKELKRIWRKAGLTPLYGRRHEELEKGFKVIKADEKLEREFPRKGDNTVYTSCLLRIKLLEGEKLEEWQIYKALRSAIQRRGYDVDVPWKTTDKDSKHYKEKVNQYDKELEKITKNENFHYPCYYDAYQMNLWGPEKGIFAIRLDEDKTNRAKRARSNSHVASRKLVEKEVKNLWEQAGKQVPNLQKFDVMEVLYGKEGEAYKHTTKQEGILDQKVPRFDNRMLNSCCLIPRFHTCRAKEQLAIEQTFLMKLYNLRYFQDNDEKRLSAEEIREIYKGKKEEVKKLYQKWNKEKNSTKQEEQNRLKKVAKTFKITETEWKKFVEKKFQGIPVPENNKVDEAGIAGRSRFSRPALKLMIELILSGKSPQEFKNQKLDEFKKINKYKLEEKDLDFLNRMGDNWEKGIYVPNIPLSEQKKDNLNKSHLQLVLAHCTDPIVKHRLALFEKEFDKLVKKFGEPDKVRLEFIREDFMGEKAKNKFRKVQRENEENNKEAMEELLKRGKNSRKNRIRWKLLKEQKGECLYKGDSLCQDKLEEYQIDHIVPESKGGSSNYTNLILTTKKNNKEKDDRIPFEWLKNKGKWGAYYERVKKSNLSKRKKLLLTSKDALRLDENNQSLAETAWIAKLARDLVALKLGYDLGEEGEAKRVQVVNGSLTAGMRRKYSLNKLLNLEKLNLKKEFAGKSLKDCRKIVREQLKEIIDEDIKAKLVKIFYYFDLSEEEIQEEIENFSINGHKIKEIPLDKKNRSDKRHHALDAIVISFLEEWAMDKNKRSNFLFSGRGSKKEDYEKKRKIIDEALKAVIPKKIAFPKAGLLEQACGFNPNHQSEKVFQRKSVEEYFKDVSSKNVKNKLKDIVSKSIRQELKDLFENCNQDFDIFKEKLKNFKLKNGTILKNLKVFGSDKNYFSNLSKDKGTFKGQYYGNASSSSSGEKNWGYYLTRKNSKIEIHKINSFDSPYLMKKKLIKEGYEIITNDRIFAGCLIELKNDFKRGQWNIPKGLYTLKGLQSNGVITLENCGQEYTNFRIYHLLEQTEIERIK